MPTDDLTDPQIVLQELLDADQGVRDAFAQALEPELKELAAALAESFSKLQPLLVAGERVNQPRTNLMIALAFGVIDDIVVSTKLLLAGKLPASGNVMRQALEGLAMALLCSTDALLAIEKKPEKRPVQARYWEKFMKGDSRVQGQHALRQLAWNAGVLGVNPDGVGVLQRAQKFFHPFSHCGQLAIASRAALAHPGRFHIGGHFEDAKLGGYRIHMGQHIGLCGVLPPFLEYLLGTLSAAAPAAEVAA
ncbi:hypothetical protein DF016_10895 [Burkholderia stagnalis]|uniref:Uncharacterized protein n=1 Tax=Burkholderia stagnalis TaxID=1503054 RepID=A0ABX9YSZ2_9BURK|nr:MULTISPECIES: hypothetical protein [Burkholderia]MDD1494060.1 hypothetical protein [Burkholderia thailandensis]RQY93836.1 hypothetical protein DF017_12475 [Burkholderia stagnalis]RQZ19558.1 hypothetical protein DF016_10895 [Burkholderia stagnalis]